mmetsp:Transcript_14098/g.37154  ORF Transcript_14098/g.37154 Transcript_14098/m.37154 type:complete len:243 (+) Transcript_14098:808-1536(+)
MCSRSFWCTHSLGAGMNLAGPLTMRCSTAVSTPTLLASSPFWHAITSACHRSSRGGHHHGDRHHGDRHLGGSPRNHDWAPINSAAEGSTRAAGGGRRAAGAAGGRPAAVHVEAGAGAGVVSGTWPARNDARQRSLRTSRSATSTLINPDAVSFYLDTHKQSPAAARALSCRSRGRALCLAPWQSQTSISVGCGAAMVDSRLVQDRPTTRAACAVGSRRRCGRGLPRRGSRWKRSYSAAWARA